MRVIKKIIPILVFLFFLSIKSFSETLNIESELFKSAVNFGVANTLYWDPDFNRSLCDDKLRESVLKNLGKTLDAVVLQENDQDDPKIVDYEVVIPKISLKFPPPNYTMCLRLRWNGKFLTFLNAISFSGDFSKGKKIKLNLSKNCLTIASKFSGGTNEGLEKIAMSNIQKLFQSDHVDFRGQHFFVAPYDKNLSPELIFFWVEKNKIIKSEIKQDDSGENQRKILFEPMATSTIDLGERDPDEKLGKSMEYNEYLSYMLVHCVKDGILVQL